MENIIAIFLTVLGLYFGCGLLFALYFAFVGATKIDPLLKDSKKGVRALLFPGVMAIWPFLLSKHLKKRA